MSGGSSGERLGVIGAGYLGATQAVCLAELGHDVVAMDVDRTRVRSLAAGELPFFEPGLPRLLRRHLATGRLRFTDSMAEVARHADVHLVCVGTPQQVDGIAADTRQVVGAVAELVRHVRRPALVVGRSTVPVGTAGQLAARCRRWAPPDAPVDVAWSPEFSREGRAVADTLHPDRLVLGVSSEQAEQRLRAVFRPLLEAGVPLVVTDPATAELVKVSANAFLATKVSFANALAELCERAGADVVTLTRALGQDARIGERFLRAGLGYGGGCLPKDVRALAASASELGAGEAFAFLHGVDAVNLRRRAAMVRLAVEECGGDVRGCRIAVLGASFKPGTDDVRDSPALDVAARLHALGAQVAVHDPRALAAAARAEPALRYVDAVEAAVAGAGLVLHLTEWPAYGRLDPRRLRRLVAVPRLVDGRGTLDTDRWRAAGWSVRTLGGMPDARPVGPPVPAPRNGRANSRHALRPVHRRTS